MAKETENMNDDYWERYLPKSRIPRAAIRALVKDRGLTVDKILALYPALLPETVAEIRWLVRVVEGSQSD